MDEKPTVVNIEERVSNLVKGMATMLSFSNYFELSSQEDKLTEFDNFLDVTGLTDKLEKIMIDEFNEKGLTAEA